MTDLCAESDVPDGGALLVSREDGSIVLVRDGADVYAYENVCPHFGVPLEIGKGIKVFRKHVLCVNHYAAFRFADGACVDGPCLGASLTPVAVAIENGRVATRE